MLRFFYGFCVKEGRKEKEGWKKADVARKKVMAWYVRVGVMCVCVRGGRWRVRSVKRAK